MNPTQLVARALDAKYFASFSFSFHFPSHCYEKQKITFSFSLFLISILGEKTAEVKL